VRSSVTLRLIIFAIAAIPVWPQVDFRPSVPKTWDETKLEDWATPLAGINVRPVTISAREYYALPIDNLKTYPVYLPGHEPAGYWEWLQKVGPKPLFEVDRLKTEADWIDAGRQMFFESDTIQQRTLDPRLIKLARDSKALKESGVEALPNGVLPDIRWVPTEKGVALSVPQCGTCHTTYQANGEAVPGAPFWGIRRLRPSPIGPQLHLANRLVNASAPFFMGTGSFGDRLYQAFGVPWLKDDIHQRLKTMSPSEWERIRRAYVSSGGLPRWNGSPFYPHKVPDLIGIRERKYIDATATHLHRDVGDLMRYAALVAVAEPADFGTYHMIARDTERVRARRSDEALYALALYIYSLKPPHNPNTLDDKAKAGQAIFTREGCPGCHTPPLYTNNRVTLAIGFSPPPDRPATLNVLPVSVGTDPGLAMATRKGTGYYKVPSLKGVWYRGRYLHHGAVASLEEMFDPDRLKETHQPGGWHPYDEKTYAIRGHEFGLKLRAVERDQLIAFLRTL
jgi:hypothetical protein